MRVKSIYAAALCSVMALSAVAAPRGTPAEADVVARLFCSVKPPPDGPRLRIEVDAYLMELRCAVDYSRWLLEDPTRGDDPLHILALNEQTEANLLSARAAGMRRICAGGRADIAAGKMRDEGFENACPGF
jgi:hypothetical protein